MAVNVESVGSLAKVSLLVNSYWRLSSQVKCSWSVNQTLLFIPMSGILPSRGVGGLLQVQVYFFNVYTFLKRELQWKIFSQLVGINLSVMTPIKIGSCLSYRGSKRLQASELRTRRHAVGSGERETERQTDFNQFLKFQSHFPPPPLSGERTYSRGRQQRPEGRDSVRMADRRIERTSEACTSAELVKKSAESKVFRYQISITSD
jgi:hypothetical protein